MSNNDTAIRKRSQITSATRTMFIWIAIASALLATAVVVGIFLFQKIAYQEKVLGVKFDTARTLDSNLEHIETLKSEIKKLDANAELLSIKANDTDETLQVVLDALPSDANTLALGASLQNRLLTGIPGDYKLVGIQITPAAAVVAEPPAASTTDTAATATPTADSSMVELPAAAQPQSIQFTISVEGDQAALRQVLQNLERSIRTIVVDNVSIEMQSSKLTMSITGNAFFLPETTLKLTDKPVPVGDTK